MVSELLSCWPVRVRLASRPGLLLLLGEGNEGAAEDDDGEDADNMDLQPGEGLLLPSPGDEADIVLQPKIKGQQGEGELPPSHGEDADNDLLKPQIAGRNSDEGILPPFRGEYAENNLLAPTIERRKEKKGSVPVSKTAFTPVPDGDLLLEAKGSVPVSPGAHLHAFDESDDEGVCDAHAAYAGSYYDESDGEDKSDADEDGAGPEDAADGYDVEPDALADGEEDESDASADEGTCDAHADSEYADNNTTSDNAHVDAIAYANDEPYDEMGHDPNTLGALQPIYADYAALYAAHKSNREDAESAESDEEHAAYSDFDDVEFEDEDIESTRDAYRDVVGDPQETVEAANAVLHAAIDDLVADEHADIFHAATGASLVEFLFSPLWGSKDGQAREKFFHDAVKTMKPKARVKMKAELHIFYLAKCLLDPGI